MPFLRIQKLKLDSNGQVVSGSASVVESVYDPKVKGHSRKQTKTALGKILYLSEDRKSGIFFSMRRGILEYDSKTDQLKPGDEDDPRIVNTFKLPHPQVHTSFGDVYILLSYMKQQGWLKLLRSVWRDDEQYERVLAHLAYNFLTGCERYKCEPFIEQSALCHLLTDVKLWSLMRDTAYFEMMGRDDVKMAYFKAYAAMMREKEVDFGKACYVDSSPLPNDVKDNPYNALRMDHKTGTSVETRLGLVLDELTDLPVWYHIFPGNINDANTFFGIVKDVRTSLGIEIISAVVDAGYVTKEFVQHFAGDGNRLMLSRMPHRNGYPFDELFKEFKEEFFDLKYDFIRRGRSYFGKKKKITLFDTELYAYGFLDKRKMLTLADAYRVKHAADYEKLTPEEKEWYVARFGYFILFSNFDADPSWILTKYIERVSIESLFKTAKEFGNLLPLREWTTERVLGKILEDLIVTTIRIQMYRDLPHTQRDLTDWFNLAATIQCSFTGSKLEVEYPNKQMKEAFAYFGIVPPADVEIQKWREEILNP